jgi:hypothetical protein
MPRQKVTRRSAMAFRSNRVSQALWPPRSFQRRNNDSVLISSQEGSAGRRERSPWTPVIVRNGLYTGIDPLRSIVTCVNSALSTAG